MSVLSDAPFIVSVTSLYAEVAEDAGDVPGHTKKLKQLVYKSNPPCQKMLPR